MLKNIWKDPVWSKVIATAILAVLGIGGAYASNRWADFSIGDSIINFLDVSYSWATSRSSIPNWLSLIIGLLVLPTILVFLIFLWNLIRGENTSPSWRSYKEDVFFGIRWRWKYIDESITEVHTFCPHCDFQVYPQSASAYIAVERIEFQCDSCHRRLGIFEENYGTLKNKAIRFAQQKLRNGSWNGESGVAM